MIEFYPKNILIKNNTKIQNQFSNYLTQMIIFQQTQISQLLQKVKNLLKNNQELEETNIFVSINTTISENINKTINNISRKVYNKDTTDCSFCKKIAAYIDKDMKYYCWFHRSQLEGE